MKVFFFSSSRCCCSNRLTAAAAAAGGGDNVCDACSLTRKQTGRGMGDGGRGWEEPVLLFGGVDVLQWTSVYPGRVHRAPVALSLLLQVVLQY